jgi:hypothetical protein
MKYRFKTEKEFIKEFGDAWVYNIHDNQKNTWCWASPDMNYLFGTVLEIDFPDDVNSIRIDDNYNIYYITRNMLIENEIPKPNYLPRKKRN